MAKVMKEASVVAEEKELDFGDLELRIAKPELNKDKTISIAGNFSDLGSKIQAVVNRYKDTQLTDDNVEYVTMLKRQFVSLRTGIEKERKDYKKIYITPAEDLVDSMCKELLKIVDEGESALGKQLEAYDQRRKDELTLVLNEYVQEAVEQFGLREEYASQIQLKKEYYNKTQKEEDSIESINAQAEELSKKQKEYDAGVELIKMECEDTGFVPDTYIRELKYKSATEIVYEIKADKKARAEMKAKVEAEEKVEIGKKASLDDELKAQMNVAVQAENAMRVRILKVTYKPEQAKLIAKFFRENNIDFEFINQDF